MKQRNPLPVQQTPEEFHLSMLEFWIKALADERRHVEWAKGHLEACIKNVQRVEAIVEQHKSESTYHPNPETPPAT